MLALALAVMLAVGRGAAQEEFFHPELDWKSIETEHFFVHYHEGAGRTARVVAKIAEEIYEPVTSFYDHRPDSKVSLIIRDVDDVSNGAAYFYENRIEILAPSMDFEFRGTHNWLRNVVTHEFTHVVQIQTAMKFGRTVPGAYLKWLNYESERRPDVLYGYPNVIVSYPYSGFVVPVWFAEGVAQYNRPELRYDFWDTHRDMILRSYALDSTMLSWEEMGVFGKTSLGNESAYNAGFAFVTYLARTYGEEKIAEISRNLSSFGAASIDVAIEKATGKPGREVYAEWRAALEREYAARTEPVRRALREGERLITEERGEVVNPRQIQAPEGFHRPRAGQTPPATFQPPCCRAVTGTGFANLYPAFSPDGTKIAYTSTKGGDYFSLSHALYVYDTATGEEKMVQAASPSTSARSRPTGSGSAGSPGMGRQTSAPPAHGARIVRRSKPGHCNAEPSCQFRQSTPARHDQAIVAARARHCGGTPAHGADGSPARARPAFDRDRIRVARRHPGHVVRRDRAGADRHAALPARRCVVPAPAEDLRALRVDPVAPDRHARAAAGVPARARAPVPERHRRLLRGLPRARGAGLRRPALRGGRRLGRGDAKGGPGWAKGQATLRLLAEAEGARIVARGEAQIGGAIATVGQRMLEGVTKSMANEFFQSLERELAGQAAPKVSASGFGFRVLLDRIRRFFARLFGRGGS